RLPDLPGHYSYCGITGNSVAITRFRHEAQRVAEVIESPSGTGIAVHSSYRWVQRTREFTSWMRQSRTSGSVGAPGGRLPGATRLVLDLGGVGLPPAPAGASVTSATRPPGPKCTTGRSVRASSTATMPWATLWRQ